MSVFSTTRIGFLGSGNMAEAILRGILKQPWCVAGNLYITDARPERTAQLAADLAVVPVSTNAELVSNCDVIVLAIKPQTCAAVLEEIRSSFTGGKVLLSILAGTTLATLERGLLHPNNMQPRVVRLMPNTPALILRGVSAYAPGQYGTEEDIAITEQIFQAIGLLVPVEEDQLDAVTGLTGSGPAYVFRMLEALIEAGIAEGLPRQHVPRMVLELVAGAAELALQSSDTPTVLREKVTSPNGTTAAGLAYLESQRFGDVIKGCVNAATQRSRELARGGK
jgi:pyrroline-5-carboxylate reductase